MSRPSAGAARSLNGGRVHKKAQISGLFGTPGITGILAVGGGRCAKQAADECLTAIDVDFGIRDRLAANTDSAMSALDALDTLDGCCSLGPKGGPTVAETGIAQFFAVRWTEPVPENPEDVQIDYNEVNNLAIEFGNSKRDPAAFKTLLTAISALPRIPASAVTRTTRTLLADAAVAALVDSAARGDRVFARYAGGRVFTDVLTGVQPQDIWTAACRVLRRDLLSALAAAAPRVLGRAELMEKEVVARAPTLAADNIGAARSELRRLCVGASCMSRNCSRLPESATAFSDAVREAVVRPVLAAVEGTHTLNGVRVFIPPAEHNIVDPDVVEDYDLKVALTPNAMTDLNDVALCITVLARTVFIGVSGAASAVSPDGKIAGGGIETRHRQKQIERAIKAMEFSESL